VNSFPLLWLVLAIPAAVTLTGYAADTMTYGEVVHASGEWSVRLLIVTMAITPLRLLFRCAEWPYWLTRRRRSFGVATFAYAILHTLVYVLRKADFALVVEEGSAPELATGWLALGIFAALAITSNDASLRLLRRSWKALHRFVYAAAVLTFAHWLLIAFDIVPGLIYAAILIGLEGSRLAFSRSKTTSNVV
jgi:sulfoxide reductase heme-binding subunit YedZ